MRGLSPAAASGGHSSSWCVGLSPPRPLLLWSTSSRRAGSVVVVHGPSCSAACGIFPDQGANPCPLHWQADSQPLRHQGSPWTTYFNLAVHPLTVCITSLEDDIKSLIQVGNGPVGLLHGAGHAAWSQQKGLYEYTGLCISEVERHK